MTDEYEHIGFGSDHWTDDDGEHYILHPFEPWPEKGHVAEYDASADIGGIIEFNFINGSAKYRVVSIDKWGGYNCELIESTYTPYVRPKQLESDFEMIGRF